MKITGKILSLDMATSTGWACGLPDESPAFGTHVFASTGDRFGLYQKNGRDWFAHQIDLLRPTYVIYEQPSLFGKNTQPATVRKLCSLANTIEEVCDHHKIRCEQANPSTVKKFWTGKGNAKKPDMVAWAKRYGFKVSTDDEADALAMFYYAIECYGTAEQKEAFRQLRFLAGFHEQLKERF